MSWKLSQPRIHQPIGLGDLIRAIGTLQASDEDAATIAVMLSPRPAGSDPTRSATPVVETAASLKPTNLGAEPRSTPTPSRSASSEPVAPEADHELTFVGTDLPPARGWLSEVEALEPPAVTPSYDATTPPFEPLLAPMLARAVLAEAASTRTNDGPINIDSLVHDMATQHPVGDVPRLPTLTLRRGAQILVDRAASMQPFQLDADDLATRIKQVTSQGATQLLYFDEDPTIVGDTWPVDDGRPHEAPPPGTPIIMITDLGIRNLRSRRSRVNRYWISFTTAAHRHRCPVIAFVPYPPSRWPMELTSLVTAVRWDRKTTVASVRAIRRNGNH